MLFSGEMMGFATLSPSYGIDTAAAGTAPVLVPRPILRPQEVRAELVEAGATDLAHHEVDLGLEDVDRLLDPGQSAGNRAVKRRAAEGDKLRAEAHRDQDIGAAPHATVEHDRHPVADRRLDRRQRVERGGRPIELAAAVVRHEDAVGADLGGADRVGRVQDALDDQRPREQPAIAFEVAPGLRRRRGLGAVELQDLRDARAVAGMRHPVAERGCATVPDVVVHP
jgi:hypothetical protein